MDGDHSANNASVGMGKVIESNPELQREVATHLDTNSDNENSYQTLENAGSTVNPCTCGSTENTVDGVNSSIINETANTSSGPDQPDTQPMSKRKLKKLKKKERWEERKAEKRAVERERKRQRRAEAREQGIDLGPSRKRLKKVKMKQSKCDIKVVVDCSFDHLMSEKDITSLVKQLNFCYAANRRGKEPLQFYICNFGGRTKQRFDEIGDYKNWDMYFKSEDYLELFGKDVVYLSSESPNILTDLDPSKAYIIGGLIDHNVHKGLCHKLACEKGLEHAQLPISEFLDMKTRKVLAINHVHEILLRYTESHDWEDAFFKVIPKRKGAVAKSDGLTEDPESVDSNASSLELQSDNSQLLGQNDAVEKQSSSSKEVSNEVDS
ncbi:tRNA methyltransferase 10 homolog A [Lingula anatina]|uniref:tRNA (guanine(9)-N(1))-methyltransferase n=1 Tax=Lingula anatina TaxID=7574 RepID=A0A1S3I2J5_LINAN|nr:tRNA methyltransferase 10 homolog A [Lingula anatina]|eukprot:XP_013392490.1 tRNA methyltransferase 10 homolog A [Lingula anatina]